MAQQNLVSFNVPAADLEEIKAAINTLRTKLAPHLKTLSPEERHGLLKMGDKTIAFVQKALDYSLANPDLVPQFLNVEEFGVDLAAVEVIRSLYQPLLQTVESLDDTMMLSGNEAYVAALIFYQSVKSAAKSNIANAKTIFEDLSNRFPGKTKTEKKV